MPENFYNKIHTPVLMSEVLADLQPVAEGRYLDATLGLGGHAEAILASAPESCLAGLDRDGQALALAKERLEPFGDRVNYFQLEFDRFSEALHDLGWQKIDGALLDLGVSSLQLDDERRGFSYRSQERLDMRMDQESGSASAWQLVNRASFDQLNKMIAILGEEPQAGRIARSIMNVRQQGTIDTCEQLAAIVWNAYPPAWRRKSKRHPATRTFQALRMTVNDELGQLERFLRQILPWIKIDGILVIITFHSLEDRLVKNAFRNWAQGCICNRSQPMCTCGHVPEVKILHKKPLMASEQEIALNPRASSAKMRAVQKIQDYRNDNS